MSQWLTYFLLSNLKINAISSYLFWWQTEIFMVHWDFSVRCESSDKRFLFEKVSHIFVSFFSVWLVVICLRQWSPPENFRHVQRSFSYNISFFRFKYCWNLSIRSRYRLSSIWSWPLGRESANCCGHWHILRMLGWNHNNDAIVQLMAIDHDEFAFVTD